MAIDFNTGKDQSAAGYLYSLQYFFFRIQAVVIS